MDQKFLTSTRKLFEYYKSLGDKSIAQINDEEINWRPNEASNSIAHIVHHSERQYAFAFYRFPSQ